jgi:hypothetical protein
VRTREELENCGLHPEDCAKCQEVRIWVTCEEHEAFILGFRAGFKYAESLEVPPVSAGASTTIIFTPGIPQPNIKEEQ